MSLLNPYLYIWLFVFSIPWENTVTLPGFGASSIIGAAVFIMSMLYLAVTRKPLYTLPVFYMIILFVTLILLSNIWTLDGEKTWSRSKQFVQLALMIWLIYQQMDTHDRIHRLLFAYVLGAYVSLANLFLGYIRGTSEYSEYGRFSAEGFNPNDIALLLSIAIPMSWYLMSKFKSKISIIICKFYLPLAVFAIVLTGSRGSFLAMLISLLVVPLFTNTQQSKRLISIASVLLVMLFLIVKFAPTTSFDRILSIKSEVAGGDLTHRRDIWETGLLLFKENVLFGVGSGAFPVAIRPYYGKEIVVHNTFLSVLYELGVIGFILFISILVTTVKIIFSLNSDEMKLLLITLSIWFVGVQTGSWEYNKTTWLIIVLPWCYKTAQYSFSNSMKHAKTIL